MKHKLKLVGKPPFATIMLFGPIPFVGMCFTYNEKTWQILAFNCIAVDFVKEQSFVANDDNLCPTLTVVEVTTL